MAFLPEPTVAKELAAGTLKRGSVPGLKIERTIRLVYQGDVLLSRAAQALLEVVRAHGNGPGH